MIYTYNDTKKAGWELVDNMDEMKPYKILKCAGLRMLTIREDKVEAPRDMEDNLKITNRVNILYRKNTYIGFNKKSFAPSIYATDRKGSAGKYNFLCLQIDISAGEKLINMNKYNFAVFKYMKDVKNKCLRFIIGNHTESIEGKFTLYFKSYDENIIIKKTWILDKTKSKFSYYEHFNFIAKNPVEGERGHIKTDDLRVNGEYNVRKFIPKLCCNAVFIPDTGEEGYADESISKFKSLYNIEEGKISPFELYPVNCNDEPESIVMNLATIIKYHHCKVCTIFDVRNSGCDVAGKEKVYLDGLCFIPNGANIDTWKEALNEFEHVTILMNDGKILIYK